MVEALSVFGWKFIWPTKHPPIAWKTLIKPKDDGGWGLKDLSAWNKALLTKTIWKIQSKKDSLWIKWVSHAYDNFGSVWNWTLHKDDSPLMKQIAAICKILVEYRGSIDSAKDCVDSWFNNKNGTRKAYDFFVRKVGRWPWKPLVWKSFLLPKHRFSLWLFSHRKLSTKDRQSYIPDKRCVLCSFGDESSCHLFFKCAFTVEVWSKIRQWVGMNKIMASSTSLLRAFRGVYRGCSRINKLRAAAVTAYIYIIWNARNRVIFDGESVSVDVLTRRIMLVVLRSVPENETGLH